MDQGAVFEPVLHRSLLLAGSALGDPDGELDRATRRRIVDGLLRWMTDTEAVGRQDAVDTLYRLGSEPYAVEQLLDKAADVPDFTAVGDVSGPGREEIEVDGPTVSADNTTRLHGELFGIPQVEAKTYPCGSCDLAILAQEVVWDEDDNPCCPHCRALLGAAE